MSKVDDRIRATVFRSCVLLDENRYDDYLELWSPNGKYRITSWSPDLRKELVLLDLDVDAYRTLLSNIQHHQRMLGHLSRHITGQLIEENGDGRAKVTSSLLVVHTDLEGVSKLFAVGKYLDRMEDMEDSPLISAREVRLETRQLGPGSHIPI